MSFSRYISLVVSFSMVLCVAPLVASAVDSVVILPIETSLSGSLANDILDELTTAITTQLKMKVRRQVGFSLDEARLTFECGDESAQCMAAAGKAIKTPILFWGTLTTQDGLALRLRGVNVFSKGLDYSLNASFKTEMSLKNSLPEVVAAFVEKRPYESRLRLSLTTMPSGASIMIDGKPRGYSPLDLMLTYGEHSLELSVEGYDVVRETLRLKASIEERTYTLSPGVMPVHNDDNADEEPGRPNTRKTWPLWLGVSMSAAGVTAVALGAYYGLKSRAIDREMNARATKDQKLFNEAETPSIRQEILNAFERNKREKTNEFNSAKIKANLGFVIGAVALSVSAFGFYKYFGQNMTVSLGPNQLRLSGDF